MKKLFAVLVAGLFACGSAYAADTKTDKKTDAMNPQQNKMKTCQAEAGDKKLEGKARQDYVNTCLKAKPVKAKSKMAECNAKTKGMSKAEADKSRSECMKA
ncbi:MAG: PsiF family protein [Pseudomonadota bacterium]|nr:PsiF family protein [Pseudomonadota bacterium]